MVSRYHVLLVALHWLLAALVIGMLVFGFTILSELSNASPDKMVLPLWHMSLGMAIVGLTVLRFFVRWRTKQPAAPRRRSAGRIVQLSSYALVLLMGVTGLATAISARLNEIVFAGSGEPLPATFENFVSAELHRLMAILLAALIASHLVAVGRAIRRGERPLTRMAWSTKKAK